MNHSQQNNNETYNLEGGPFGYIFPSAGDEPAPAPEAPARGEPLLNDFELDSSHQFFDRFQNDQFADDNKLMEALGGFQQEPAPHFHGVASSIGAPTRAMNYLEHDLNARFDQTNLTSPSDQMPSQSVLSFTSDFSPYGADRPSHHRHYSDAMNVHNTFTHPQHSLSRSSIGRQSAPALPPPDSLNFGDQSFNNPHVMRPSVQRRSVTTETPSGGARIAPALGFGSDQNFSTQSYVPPRPHLEDLQVAERSIEANMRNLEENPVSTDNTAPSSPTMTKAKRRLSDDGILRDAPGSTDRKDRNSGANLNGGDKRLRKVRLDDVEEDEESMKSQAAKKGRTNSKPRTSSTSQVSRRKSQAGDRPPRQNLTEEEKKQNHIRSEQKRRNQIKDGFTALIELMPNNVAANTSKCAILSQAVEWLSSLIEGNKQLRAQLEQMGG